jgi:hypothetical protein
MTDLEHAELCALGSPGERTFDGPTLDALELQCRVFSYDFAPDGSYRMAASELGRLALNLWPLIRIG